MMWTIDKPHPRAMATPLSLEERRLRRISKDAGPSVASWFETAQERLLTMRVYDLEVFTIPHAASAAINSEISAL